MPIEKGSGQTGGTGTQRQDWTASGALGAAVGSLFKGQSPNLEQGRGERDFFSGLASGRKSAQVRKVIKDVAGSFNEF